MDINDLITESFDSTLRYVGPMGVPGGGEMYNIYGPRTIEDMGFKSETFVVGILFEDDSISEFPSVFFAMTDSFMRYAGVTSDLDISGVFANMGISSIPVFSTVMRIVRKSSVIRDSGGFYFSAKSSEPSRVKLYERILRSNRLPYDRKMVDGDVVFIVSLRG